MSLMRITTNFFTPTEASSHDQTKTSGIRRGHSFGRDGSRGLWHERTSSSQCSPSSFSDGESNACRIPCDIIDNAIVEYVDDHHYDAVIQSCVLVPIVHDALLSVITLSYPYPIADTPTFIHTVEYLPGPKRGGYQYKGILGKCHAVPNRMAGIG